GPTRRDPARHALRHRRQSPGTHRPHRPRHPPRTPRRGRLTGKGRKTRHAPLMANTAAILAAYLGEHRLARPGHDDHLMFFNQHGTKLSPGGIAWIIGKHQARTDDPQLADADRSTWLTNL